MKMTLLEMVQDILSDMSSDYANSISDTEESLQVAQIVKSTYQEMMSRRDWPHLKKLTTLNSFNDNAYPVYLSVPENTKRLEWVTYNQRTEDKPETSYSEIKYMEPLQFVQWTNSRSMSAPSVKVIKTPGGVDIRILTDRPPTYWTSFDDSVVVMDSFVSKLEDTLQGHNSQCELYVFPVWREEDNFVPDLPSTIFPALLAEAKSTSFLVIKGMANEKAEQQSVRQQKFLSNRGWKLDGGIKYPNYGRRQWIR